MAQGTLTVTIRDEKGATGFAEIELAYPNTITDNSESPFEFGTNLILLIDALITGVVVRANFSGNVTLPTGLKTVPQGKADVEEKGVFKWELGNVPELHTFTRLPTFREDLILYGTDRIDLEDADVAAFIAMMVDPQDDPAAWVVEPVDGRGVDITALISAYERFKRRK